jgi:hypothetical protein
MHMKIETHYYDHYFILVDNYFLSFHVHVRSLGVTKVINLC